MSLLSQHTTANDPDFYHRVEQAAINVAVAIAAEPGTTGGHSPRAAFASTVLHDAARQARKIAYGVAAQGIDNTSSDADLQNAVSALWNAYAGYNPNA